MGNSNFSKLKFAYAAVFVLFAVSVIIKLPHLNRPLSKHHEFNPAVVLICIDTWNQNGGPSYTGYTPVFNYSNEGDLYLPINKGMVHDAKGNSIYISFGSGFFLYPYYFFKVFGLPATPLSLQIFTLILCLISAFLVFSIAVKLFNENQTTGYFASLVTVFVFLFNPAVLWYFGNGYDHEIMTYPFFLAAVNMFVSFVKNDRKIGNGKIFLYALIILAGIFCDWLMLLWCAVTVSYAILKFRQDRKWTKYIFWVSFAVLLSAAVVFSVFIRYIGADQYFSNLVSRLQKRTVAGNNLYDIVIYAKAIITHYFTSYFPVFLLLGLFAFISRNKINIQNLRVHTPLVFLSGIIGFTGLLHHIIFMNFSAVHEFSVIKSSLFLSICCGVLIRAAVINKQLKIALLLFFLAASVSQFYYINPAGKRSWNGDRYDSSKQIGEIIKKNAEPGEVIFVDDKTMRAQLNYYAKRSTIFAGSLNDARKRMNELNRLKNAVWFEVVNGRVRSVVHFRID